MGAQQNALDAAIDLGLVVPSHLDGCVRSGNLLITSGHTSTLKGRLGAGVQLEQGVEAAHDAMAKVLRAVHQRHGTLDGLRVLKLLGAVNSTPEFQQQHLVINGATDLVLRVFGPDLGRHARSALGFASLPNGAAVEIEAIFEVVS